PGQAKLPAPQNVTLLSKDFDMILTWAPGEGSPAGVTYTVRYQSRQQQKKWLKVPHCKNIHRTSCNLTCELPNYFVKVQGRVKAAWGRCQSPWVESQFKGYHLDVELAPPELKLSVEENSIQVNASFPLAPCVQNLLWMYDLSLWEAGSEDKVSSSGTKTYDQNPRKTAVTINTTALRGNYCLSARASYQSIHFKYSKYSQPLCVLLNHKG
ncbi:INLR1 protein, partial [Tricholaema leucomelas]|nr:INLR1 protein [Tricholaema leucomelas]